MSQSKIFTLYGMKISLYTGKLRAYLHYKGIPFEEKIATLGVYKKIIIPQTGVRFIPVLKTPEQVYLQDTAAIIDVLEPLFQERPIFPSSPKQRIVAQLFELFADEWLVIPAMHYRWNKDNDDYIYAEFGSAILPKWPAFIRRMVGKKLAAKFKGFLPILGINHSTTAAIEDWYENEFLPTLDIHFAQHSYLLGDAATIGDFALLGPLYAHLYLDPAPRQIMQRAAPNVVAWIERMNLQTPPMGDWLANDHIPDTLLPILQSMFAEQWPVLINSASALDTWLNEHPNTHKIPRILGEHSFNIGSAQGKRGVSSFSIWKMQRVLDSYLSLHSEDKQTVDELLSAVGGYEVMQTVLRNRIVRKDNRLEISTCVEMTK